MSDNNNPFLEAAIFYADRGYPVFPCVPGLKNPLPGRGFYDATTDTEQIEAWWTQNPQANVAIHTEGLVVLDVDGADNEWLQHHHELMIQLSTGAIARTPRGGSHRWFKWPEGKVWSSTVGKIAKNVDTRAAGGYVLIPPSQTADGPYAWLPGFELECKPTDLPEPPAWLVDLLDQVEKGKGAGGGNLDFTGGEIGNEISEGQRNDALARIAGNARRVGNTRAEIEALLLAVNGDRCNPPLPKSEVLKIARSISRYAPDQVATAVAEGHYHQDREEKEEEQFAHTENPGPFPEELLFPPGIIADFMDYTLQTAWVPQPVLALGAAVTLMATLTGHKVRDEFNTRTNLYCLGVAPSGALARLSKSCLSCRKVLRSWGRNLLPAMPV
jgi:hypothetical protein